MYEPTHDNIDLDVNKDDVLIDLDDEVIDLDEDVIDLADVEEELEQGGIGPNDFEATYTGNKFISSESQDDTNSLEELNTEIIEESDLDDTKFESTESSLVEEDLDDVEEEDTTDSAEVGVDTKDDIDDLADEEDTDDLDEESDLVDEEDTEPIEEDVDDLDEPTEDKDNSSLRDNSKDESTSLEIEIEETGEVKETNGVFYGSSGQIIIADTTEPFGFEVINIDKIVVVDRLRKVNTEAVQPMVQSIKSNGLLTPIVVSSKTENDTYILLDGFRRLLACKILGKEEISCVVNPNVKDTSAEVIEALYNRNARYSMLEIVDCVNKFEKMGITSPTTFEYLLQLDIGDYTKLRDVLNDNDDEIVTKLLSGELDIKGAYRKLEARRKKESKLEQERQLTEKALGDSSTDLGKVGVDLKQGEVSDSDIDEDEPTSQAMQRTKDSIEQDADNIDLSTSDSLKEANVQISGKRERLDPKLRKSVLARDNNTCQICKQISGGEYTEVLDVHHIIPAFLNKQKMGICKDEMDNLVTACVICHKLIHLDSRGDLYIRNESELTDAEKEKFKRVKAYSKIIKDGIKSEGKGLEYLKEHDNVDTIGRSLNGQVAD